MQNIIPKKAQNGRYVIKEDYKLFLGKTTPNGEEYGTASLASYIHNVVNSCDEFGVPAEITIRIYLAPNKKFADYKLYILPTIIEKHKNEPMFTEIYTCCEDHVDTLARTEKEKKANKKAFTTLADENANKAILYIQREFCLRYLELKSSEYKSSEDYELIKILENLTLTKAFKLQDIKEKNISLKKIKSLDFCDKDKRSSDYNAVYEYSLTFQQEHFGTPDTEIVAVSDNYTIIGLQKGKSEKQRTFYATLDALANQVKLDKEVIDYGIFSAYTTKKKTMKPKGLGDI